MSLSRRNLLLASGGVVASLSGCTSADAGESGVTLTDVTLTNSQQRPNEFHVLVEHDGDIVHWSSHHIDAGEGSVTGGKVVTPELPSEPGDVVVHCRVEDQHTRARLLDWGDDGSCIRVNCMLDPEEQGGSLTIWRSIEECPDSGAT